MAILHERDSDISDYRERTARDVSGDREISLGTGTILGIFVALALLCAVFFGFGYSMGRKSAASGPVNAATPQATTLSAVLGGLKPSAGSPAGSPVHAATIARAETPDTSVSVPSDPDGEIVTKTVAASNGATPADRADTHPAPSKALRNTQAEPAAAPSALPTTNPNGTSVVQVAAVSHQEDADTLIAALKKKGYAVFIRQEPQDHLLHVQLGPFGSHKEADLMRQHLLTDGYNAIVK